MLGVHPEITEGQVGVARGEMRRLVVDRGRREHAADGERGVDDQTAREQSHERQSSGERHGPSSIVVTRAQTVTLGGAARPAVSRIRAGGTSGGAEPALDGRLAIVAAALAPYPGEFGVGFYETAEGWTFTTGWRDVTGRQTDGRVRVTGDPSAIRRPIHQALTQAGKPLAGDAQMRALPAVRRRRSQHAARRGRLVQYGHLERARADRLKRRACCGIPLSLQRGPDAQIEALARVAFTGVHGALIRRLAAEVRALRDEMKKGPPGAPGR